MHDSRASGILLHPTSLPGEHGIGDLGPQAYRFIDFLAAAGQSLWQILPLGPTGYGNSPYMCFSACGGNHLLISLRGLVDQGLLDTADIAPAPGLTPERVDFDAVIAFKMPLLARAFERFEERASADQREGLYTFCEQNAAWLEDYALFMALKSAHDGRIWREWEPGAAMRSPDALPEWRNRLARQCQFQKFLQYEFFRQWSSLRAYCAEKEVRIIGDTPIYVAYDSADVWAHRDLFHLDDDGRPVVVAGVPPDYFSATGQRWGNPVYRWDTVEREGYQWWIDRLRADFAQVDIIRLDHFRGYEAYWEIPASEATAVEGRWVPGPGAAFFEAVGAALRLLDVPFNIIVEDLGVITPEVDSLRDRFDFPGMRVLQMAFGTDPKASNYRPHNHQRNCVVYTATHDHNTTVGWFTAAPGTQTTQTPLEIEQERAYALRYAASDGGEIHWDFIRLAMSSVAAMAIFPLQDVLGLGSDARMNRPGSSHGNWEWRFSNDMLTSSVRDRLGELTAIYERAPVPSDFSLHR